MVYCLLLCQDLIYSRRPSDVYCFPVLTNLLLEELRIHFRICSPLLSRIIFHILGFVTVSVIKEFSVLFSGCSVILLNQMLLPYYWYFLQLLNFHLLNALEHFFVLTVTSLLCVFFVDFGNLALKVAALNLSKNFFQFLEDNLFESLTSSNVISACLTLQRIQ